MATVNDLQNQLIKYWQGDKSRVKQMASDCKAIGFPLGENLEAIAKNKEEFLILITYSDLGILEKLASALTKLKEK